MHLLAISGLTPSKSKFHKMRASKRWIDTLKIEISQNEGIKAVDWHLRLPNTTIFT